MEKCGGKTAPYFTSEEQQLILTKYEEFRPVIMVRSNTVAAATARKECWQKIADSLNA